LDLSAGCDCPVTGNTGAARTTRYMGNLTP
jgi:hypothetical protein